jgi:hypothetical protein
MNWAYVSGYFDGEGCAGIYKVASRSPEYRRCEINFANTHLESLQAIQEFMGCGKIRPRKRMPNTKQQYSLVVGKRADLVRIIPLILEHSIIKADKLREVYDWVLNNVKDLGDNYGTLESIGIARIKQLYWHEGLTQEEIGGRIGVSQTSVAHYMKKHRLLRRTKPEAFASIKNNSKKWQQRSSKLSEMRRRNWQNTEYRENMLKKIRASQEQRIATWKRNRAAKAAVSID